VASTVNVATEDSADTNRSSHFHAGEQ
jgi:hypothetical protein